MLGEQEQEEVKEKLLKESAEDEVNTGSLSSQHSNSDCEDLRKLNRKERRDSQDSVWDRMKKYTKLLLSVVAAVSFFSFLLYKYRYDRLYNVMQVLEVFGTPDDPSFSPCPPSPSLPQYPPPTWQSVSPSLHVYSAYCHSTTTSTPSSCSQVSLLCVADKQPDFQCKLWYEGAPRPLEGVLSVTKHQESNEDTEKEKGGFLAYTLTCESKYPTNVAHAVTLYGEGGKETHIPITRTSNLTAKHFLQICILPEPSPLDSTAELRQNLIFHSFLRVPDIQIYSPSLTSSTLDTISSLSSVTLVSVSPWLSPVPLSQSITKFIVSTDCYYRSRHSHEAFIVLTKDQILLPVTVRSLPEAAKSLMQSRILSQGPNLFKVKKFCSEYSTEKQSSGFEHSLPIFESTFYHKQLSDKETVSYHSLSSGQGNPDTAIESVVSVQEYGSCHRHDFTDKDKDAQYEAGALRFSKDFLVFYGKYI